MIGRDQLSLVETPRVRLEYHPVRPSPGTTGSLRRGRLRRLAERTEVEALHEPRPDPSERR